MKLYFCIVLLSMAFLRTGFAADGVINVASPYSVKETADRFEALLNEKGFTIFTRINHAEGAKKTGIKLRDSQVIVFGNPKVGSPLMQCQQSIAIDLPQKALVWQDATNQVFISYNDPYYLQERHQVKNCDAVFAKIKQALSKLTKAIVSKN